MSAVQPSLLRSLPVPVECCSKCGQKLPRLFKHNLNKGLVSFLWSLYYVKKATKLVDLPIDKCTFANAQKIQYWGMAKSVNGLWTLTERGLLFLGNQIAVERQVVTRQGKAVERSSEKIRVSDIDEGWQTKLDYSREARLA